MAVYVIYVTVVYLAMLANPDPVEMPPELVWPFPAVAFLGLILFCAALGGAFVWLLRAASTPSRVKRGLE
jgi:NADH:ubiquinone oxidoreductase subunit 6 (subunit J)